MIIDNKVIKLESNTEPAKSLNFGISDVKLVVDILSKLYAHPIQTLVQEYICNGRDAMREAGTWGKQPIVIQVPNTLDPMFKVRDFGVGITPDRMENVFVNYGSSTKRNTNTQTGGFGIGAKSAFSYTDSFGVTSFVNGMRYVYMAHLGEQGGVVLIEKSPTKEPNGVEISIGVKPKDIAEFYNAVQRCVRFWSEPIKFIGTKDITQEKALASIGSLSVYKSEGNSRTIYLVDGIEYPLLTDNLPYYYSRREFDLHSSGHVVALHIPNGFFKIASSRERLENNDDNKQKQTNTLSVASATINNYVLNVLRNQQVPLEDRLNMKTNFSGLSEVNNFTLPLCNDFSLDHNILRSSKLAFDIRTVRRGRRASIHYETDTLSSLTLSKIVVYKNGDASNTTARKLNFWLSQRTSMGYILISEEQAKLVPFYEKLFTNLSIDVATLPLPAKGTSSKPKKTAREAIAKKLCPDKTIRHDKIHYINSDVKWITVVDEESDEAWELGKFCGVYVVPKQNKDLITIHTKTMEEAKKFLLSQNRAKALGFTCISDKTRKLSCMQKFTKRDIQPDLYEYLVKIDPSIKIHNDALQKEYDSIIAKYPLIKVLSDVYSRESEKIVFDEITKQMKGSK